MTLAKLKNPVKQSFDKVKDDMQEVYSAQNRYTKALDKVSSPRADCQLLVRHKVLITMDLEIQVFEPPNCKQRPSHNPSKSYKSSNSYAPIAGGPV